MDHYTWLEELLRINEVSDTVLLCDSYASVRDGSGSWLRWACRFLAREPRTGVNLADAQRENTS